MLRRASILEMQCNTATDAGSLQSAVDRLSLESESILLRIGDPAVQFAGFNRDDVDTPIVRMSEDETHHLAGARCVQL